MNHARNRALADGGVFTRHVTEEIKNIEHPAHFVLLGHLTPAWGQHLIVTGFL